MSSTNKPLDAVTQLRIICQEREAYLKQLQIQYPAHKPRDRVQEAIDYIHKNFFEDSCTVQYLKDELGIHDHNFSIIFKHKVTMGINEYITHHRMVLAERLLKREGLSIFQIALEIGYSTHEAFTTAFKKQHGCTPSDFQAQRAEKI